MLLAATLLLALCASAGGLSNASFGAATANRGSEIASASDWVPPTVSLTDPGTAIHGTVTLAAGAVDPYGSGVASVRFDRAQAGSGNWTTVCVDASAPYSCDLDTGTLSNDYYDLRAVATDNAGFTATDSIADVQVDNRAPVVTMSDPGTPLSGVVTLAAEASDADSGVAAVTIERSPAGKASWTEVCIATASPYACRFDTRTVAEGSYDLRATAVDAAGNRATSATVQNRRVDNTISSVSLEDPGAYLHGTVTLSANATSTAGVSAVTIQRSPAGKNSWTEICRVQAAPYSCAWNSTTVPDGSYDLRAVMTTSTGTVANSAVVSARNVDNTAVRGLDVQAANRAGGSAGRLESGDSVTFTYSEQMNPASIVSGWSGASPTPIYARLRDGNLLGTGGTGDTLQFSTDSAGNNAIRLGSVNLHGDFIKNNKTSTFNATLGAATQVVGGIGVSVLTVTVGSLASGGALKTSGIAAQMAWTPSASATDLSGNPCSTAPVFETGLSDRDL
ncbi:MAG TPA: Ig-like domain-containing protein [Solirubrobacterales bacterium]|nr:Ig-like domain-containing protein [Solirubrobacterales bacterium]